MITDIEKSIRTMQQGGVILYPTDTIWGLGCDATNEMAVRKIFEIKQRSESKSLIILVDSLQMLKDYVSEIPPYIIDFLNSVKQPTTVIYPNVIKLPSYVRASDNSVAIRCVQDVFCQRLIQSFGAPIVSTSANISGKPSPVFFSEIDNQIIESCDYVVQYRQDDIQPKAPSRLVRFSSQANIEIIR